MDKHMTLKRRTAMAWIGAVPLLARAQGSDWSKQLAAARGQTVFFNAWGGSERINSYLQWAAAELQPAFGIRLQHVKLSDTVEVVRRVRAEKAAGRSDGSADLVWINGENFLTMKREGLLFGPFAESLPNYRFVDTIGKPTTRVDFSEPVEGMEAPWGMAQLTFYADAGRLPLPPQSVVELTDWARRNPGRFTYPKPPQFHGTTFVKQVLMALSPDAAGLEGLIDPYNGQRDLQHKVLRHVTAAFAEDPVRILRLARFAARFPDFSVAPETMALMRQMVADGELIIGLTFNPNEAANAIAGKQLPATVQSWQFSGGTIGNTHFLAIPFNARAAAAAQVVADFLLSPLAQARKADIRHWGDPTVLALDKLSVAQRAAFAASAQAPGAVRQPATR